MINYVLYIINDETIEKGEILMYIELMNKNEVTLIKHSAVVQISNKMSAIQRKCYNALLYAAKKQLEANPGRFEFEIDAKILLDFFQIGDKHHIYLKEKLEELQDIKVKYNILNKDKKQKWGIFNILAGVEYDEGKFIFSFPHQVLKTLINPNVYTYIDLVIIKDLKSKYAIALYELLRDYKDIKELTIEIDKFKELMGTTNTTYSMNMFKRRVIEKAIEEINKSEKIDFKVEYELKKSGKKYTHIKFIIHKKSKVELSRLQLESKRENAKIQAFLAIIPEKYRSKALEKYLYEIIDKYEPKYIEAQIKYANSQNTQNYLAYLKSAVKEDFANYEISKEIESAYYEKFKKIISFLEKKYKEKDRKIDFKEYVRDHIFVLVNQKKITPEEKDKFLEFLDKLS